MKKNLTIKQRKFIKKYVDTGNATQSALSIYGAKNYDTAKAIGYENLTKPHLKKAVDEILIDYGITDETLFSGLRAGLRAVKIAEYRGELVETGIPDLQIQYKFLDMALKLKDLYPSQKFESRSVNIDLELERMSKEEIGSLMKEMYESGGYGKLKV